MQVTVHEPLTVNHESIRRKQALFTATKLLALEVWERAVRCARQWPSLRRYFLVRATASNAKISITMLLRKPRVYRSQTQKLTTAVILVGRVYIPNAHARENALSH
jgi:carbohydrate-binding DOMON domain-containing protein